MDTLLERAALVALLRRGRAPWPQYVEEVEMAGSAVAVHEQDQGLLAQADLEPALDEVAGWERDGLTLITLLDDDYPQNLRAVHDRPPLLFVDGALSPADDRSVAVIGSRAASPGGLSSAAAIAEHLVATGFTVFSGLAAGIDAAAHTATLARGGRTVAVIGTGVHRVYPPQNAALQRKVGDRGAVVSRFWPDAPPSRRSFPMRNALMSGLSLASVIVEASPMSGARIQARHALAHGRPVFLSEPLMEQAWARELAARPGVYRFETPEQITSTVDRLSPTAPLME